MQYPFKLNGLPIKLHPLLVAFLLAGLMTGHLQTQSGDVNTGSSTGYQNRDENPEAANSVDFADTIKQEVLKDRKPRR